MVIKLKMKPIFRMITLDITNLYISTPNGELLDLIGEILQGSAQWNVAMKKEIVNVIEVTNTQNYFEGNNTFWKQVFFPL
jgi:hypothetical protein